MKKNAGNIVKLTLDPHNLPPLSASERARLQAVAAMPDEQIDYSDAPFLPDAAWARPVDVPGGKQQITLRIDADVLDFFRETGKRYQTRINAVLRSYVQAHRQAGAR
jgi:uncharacterized protein (DUF4415 family)